MVVTGWVNAWSWNNSNILVLVIPPDPLSGPVKKVIPSIIPAGDVIVTPWNRTASPTVKPWAVPPGKVTSVFAPVATILKFDTKAATVTIW